jgi:hypothetical protein
MREKVFIWLFVFATIILIIVIFNVPSIGCTSYILNELKTLVEILSPIGIFILGMLGLSSWRYEMTFKKRYELSEEILIAMKNFVTHLKEIREIDFWNAEEIAVRNEDPLKSKNPWKLMKIKKMKFDEKKYDIKVKEITEDQLVLTDLLEKADFLWNEDISSSSKQLYSLYFDILKAIWQFRYTFDGTNEWDFEKNDIENNKSLQLIYNFSKPTENKSIDELNNAFYSRLKNSTKEIQKKLRGNIK